LAKYVKLLDMIASTAGTLIGMAYASAGLCPGAVALIGI
jgi:hypothetical protein